MTVSRFYYSTGRPKDPGRYLSFVREALFLFFPLAVPHEVLKADFKSDGTFFLKEGKKIYWIEIVPAPFTRNEITDYLARARQTQSLFPTGLAGVLAAPEFESGVKELLEFIRIPMRLFRCQEGLPLRPSFSCAPESVLCLQEITAPPPDTAGARLPFMEEVPGPEREGEGMTAAQNRLSREELKEFIQLELEMAGASRLEKR